MTTPITQTRVDTIRDHLANERTFLAWVRTSISIIVFGFVVAKFGITLREFFLIQSHVVKEDGASLYIGVGFMVVGIFIAPLALVRYRTNMHRIDANQFKPTDVIAVLLGLVTAFFGAILATYLILTAQTI